MIVVVCCLPGAAICLMSSSRTSNSPLLRILFKRWLSLEHFFLTSALRHSLWSGAFQVITWSNRCFRMSNCCSLFVWKKSDVILSCKCSLYFITNIVEKSNFLHHFLLHGWPHLPFTSFNTELLKWILHTTKEAEIKRVMSLNLTVNLSSQI